MAAASAAASRPRRQLRRRASGVQTDEVFAVYFRSHVQCTAPTAEDTHEADMLRAAELDQLLKSQTEGEGERESEEEEEEEEEEDTQLEEEEHDDDEEDSEEEGESVRRALSSFRPASAFADRTGVEILAADERRLSSPGGDPCEADLELTLSLFETMARKGFVRDGNRQQRVAGFCHPMLYMLLDRMLHPRVPPSSARHVAGALTWLVEAYGPLCWEPQEHDWALLELALQFLGQARDFEVCAEPACGKWHAEQVERALLAVQWFTAVVRIYKSAGMAFIVPESMLSELLKTRLYRMNVAHADAWLEVRRLAIVAYGKEVNVEPSSREMVGFVAAGDVEEDDDEEDEDEGEGEGKEEEEIIELGDSQDASQREEERTWVCGCGLTQTHTVLFCYSCGKVAPGYVQCDTCTSCWPRPRGAREMRCEMCGKQIQLKIKRRKKKRLGPPIDIMDVF